MCKLWPSAPAEYRDSFPLLSSKSYAGVLWRARGLGTAACSRAATTTHLHTKSSMFNFGRTHKPLPTKIAARDSERRWHSLGAHACGREKWGLTRHALLLPLGPGQRVCRSAPTQSVPQDMLCHPPVRHCSVQSVRKHVARAETSCATADFPLVIVEAGGGDARDLVNVETVRLFLHLVGVGVGAVPEVDHGESVGVAILHHDRIISSDGCVGLAHVGSNCRGCCVANCRIITSPPGVAKVQNWVMPGVLCVAVSCVTCAACKRSCALRTTSNCPTQTSTEARTQ